MTITKQDNNFYYLAKIIFNFLINCRRTIVHQIYKLKHQVHFTSTSEL